MLDWKNITRGMELKFTIAITPSVKKQQVLWAAIKWISNHLNPEDVFSENRLIEWNTTYKQEDYVQTIPSGKMEGLTEEEGNLNTNDLDIRIGKHTKDIPPSFDPY